MILSWSYVIYRASNSRQTAIVYSTRIIKGEYYDLISEQLETIMFFVKGR